MPSNIDTSTIATTSLLVAVSKPGTLALQNNFDSVKTALSTAKTEITDLQAANVDLYTNNNVLKGATLVGFTPVGSLTSTNVQAAIAEINSDLVATTGSNLVGFSDSDTYSDFTVGSAIKARALLVDLANNTDSNKGAALIGYSGSSVSTKLQSLSSTDGVTEGLSNLYFTEDRVRSSKLTGISFVDTSSVTSTDSILQSVGKLSARLDLKTKQTFILPIKDETTPIAAASAVITIRVPYNFSISEIRASLTTAQVSGSTLTIDVKKNGVSLFSTLLTIDNTLKSSKLSSVQPVLSTTSVSDDDELTVDVTQIGDSTAAGLKIYIVGYSV